MQAKHRRGQRGGGRQPGDAVEADGGAKASLDELLEDVHDWLTAHGEEEWAVDDARTASVRAFAREHESWAEWRGVFESRSGGTLANVLTVLIHQCRHLLERMMEWQEADFARHGGVRERMRTVRDGTRGQEWKPALFSWLNGAEDAEALAARAKEAARRHAAHGGGCQGKAGMGGVKRAGGGQWGKGLEKGGGDWIEYTI